MVKNALGLNPAASARPCGCLPIIPHYDVMIDALEHQRLCNLAKNLLASEPTLSATAAFGPQVSQGLNAGPSLVIEDHSGIALSERHREIAYNYRALLLARAGDFVAVSPPRSCGFEDYCRNLLGLGDVAILTPVNTATPRALAVRCANDEELVGRVAEVARKNGGLNIVPYMGTGGVWMLAQRIAARARVPVCVAAPPPRLTRRVNDKVWFTARVREVLGGRATPSSKAVYNLASLTGQITRLAKQHRSVAIKIPDSASSEGNIVFHSQDLRKISLGHLRNRAAALLRSAGWREEYPLMVTAWEESILASPSVQIWVPQRAEGPPVVEGIFDQIIAGPARVFNGAMPSDLPADWQRRLAQEAARLACLFQKLGYFGRCSFDAIVVGDDLATADLHWVECNGRWGGVSIPMTLANRLLGDWTQRPPVIVKRADLKGSPQDFAEVVAKLEAELFRPGVRDSGAVILSPNYIAAGTGFEVMVLGHSTAAAQAQAEAIAASLTQV